MHIVCDFMFAKNQRLNVHNRLTRLSCDQKPRIVLCPNCTLNLFDKVCQKSGNRNSNPASSAYNKNRAKPSHANAQRAPCVLMKVANRGVGCVHVGKV